MEGAAVRLRRYTDVPACVSSDHKPVCAEFDVRVDGFWRPNEDEVAASKLFSVRHGRSRLGTSRGSAKMVAVAAAAGTAASEGGSPGRNGAPYSSERRSSVCAVM